MSQPSQLSPDRPSDIVTYRPLSGLAIASLACGGLYTAIVLASAVGAMVQGSPVFLTPWFLVLPLAGVVLALLAQWRIRAAEGTMAGATVAKWGLWLSVLAGLGYGTYDTFTGIAVKQQANRFLMEAGPDAGFFPRLLKGDRNGAFLLTRVPAERASARPDDEKNMSDRFDQPMGSETMGSLSVFRQSDVADTVVQAGKENKEVEVLGVRDCSYAQKGYKVVRNYRVRTSEVTMDLTVTVQSTESGEPGEGRKWFVVWTREATGPLSTTLTPLGNTLRQFRQGSVNALQQWANKLIQGRTLPIGASLKIGDLDNVPAPMPAGKSRADVDDFLQRLLKGKVSDLGPTFKVQTRTFGPWERTKDGKLRLQHSFVLMFPTGEGTLQYAVQGEAVVESVEVVDPETFSGTPEWRIERLDVRHIRKAARKGGPGG